MSVSNFTLCNPLRYRPSEGNGDLITLPKYKVILDGLMNK